MKSAEVSAEMKEELTALVPAERVTGVRLGDGFLVIYFDSNRKSDGVNRLGAPPLPWSAGPAGRIVDTFA